jgi:cytochrome P450
MASLFLLIPSTLLLVLLILRVTRWTSNYIAARKIGLPILLSPFSWQEPLYMLLGSHLSFLRHLPFGLGAWTQYSLLGWPLHSSYHLHHKLGPAFTIVSPAKNEITVADPVAAEELLSKYKVWTKPSELYEIFNVFGKNVNSVNGEDWQRHRKITGTTFKESNYRIVWDESVKQAGQMCKVWEKAEEITLRRVIDDFALLAMHVLAMGGFGKEYDFDGTGLDEVEAGHQISYGTAMKTILLNVMSVVLFSGLKAPSWLLPKSLKELQVATKDFKKYLAERVADERKSAEKGEIKDNLMSMLVRANEAAKNEDGARMVLSDDELYGNLFIFNLAGYETTAGTLVYALSLLAAFPDVQNWVMEEVDSNTERIQKGNYDEAFPKLVRCLAVMVSYCSTICDNS